MSDAHNMDTAADMPRLTPEPTIHATASVRDCRLGRYVEIRERAWLLESTLGDYSYVMEDVDVAYTEIGRFANIAAQVRLCPTHHPMTRASLHHFTYRSSMYDLGEDDSDFFTARRAHGVSVGHDSWIGHAAIVLPGVRVGIGAVIGAGSVVTRDVPDWTIVAGNPARVLRERFPETIRQRLAASRWWEMTHAELREHLPWFRLDVETFLDHLGH